MTINKNDFVGEAPDKDPPHASLLREGRYSEKHALYFVTKCLKPGTSFTDAQKQHAVDAFAEFSQKGRWLLHAFVVMPDHWHALFSLGEGEDLSQMIQKMTRWISFPTRK